jgi:hypothetical protein
MLVGAKEGMFVEAMSDNNLLTSPLHRTSIHVAARVLHHNYLRTRQHLASFQVCFQVCTVGWLLRTKS